MNTAAPRRSLTPYFIGFTVVAILASLGLWQISRGMDKRAGLDAYSSAEGHTWYEQGDAIRPFQQVRIRGAYDSERQLLLDNMIVDGRVGHYVITPLRLEGSDSVLLVNRGWIAPGESLAEQVSVDESGRTVLGRVGQLPRAGVRMGDPFEGSIGWPRHAVYPLAEEVAELLDEPLARFVLLMDEDQADGFVRRWEPEEMSASRHFGYAFQWFAMAAMASGLLVWRLVKRRNG
ncbi:MAG: SURF1 family protein [Pseudomonadota bacterium]